MASPSTSRTLPDIEPFILGLFVIVEILRPLSRLVGGVIKEKRHLIARCLINMPQSCAVLVYPKRWAPPRRGLLHNGLSAPETASYQTTAKIELYFGITNDSAGSTFLQALQGFGKKTIGSFPLPQNPLYSRPAPGWASNVARSVYNGSACRLIKGTNPKRAAGSHITQSGCARRP